MRGPGHVGRVEQAALPDGTHGQTGVAQRLDFGLFFGGGDVFAHHGAGPHGPCHRWQGGGCGPVAHQQRAIELGQLGAEVAQGIGQPRSAVRAHALKSPRAVFMQIGQAIHRQQGLRAASASCVQCGLVVQAQVVAEPKQHSAHALALAGAALLDSRLQRSEQYFTSSQQRSHFLRHVNGKLQCWQGFSGRFSFLCMV